MNKKKFTIAAFFSVIIIICVLVLAGDTFQRPIAISPGCDNDVAQVDRVCPTFSWSGLGRAVAYRLAVFESDGHLVAAYEQLVAQASPVLQKHIPGPALSWTPSAKEGLKNGGVYVWYVAAVDEAGTETWSEGMMFTIEAAGGNREITNAPSMGLTTKGLAAGKQTERVVINKPRKLTDFLFKTNKAVANAAIPATASAPSAGEPYITVYTGAKYTGTPKTLSYKQNGSVISSQYLKAHGIHDNLSSIKFNNGAVARVWKNWVNGKPSGPNKFLYNDTSHLSDYGMNDNISAISLYENAGGPQCYGYIEIYEHAFYRGQVYSLLITDPKKTYKDELNDFNDKASSIFFFGQNSMTVRLFVHGNYEGYDEYFHSSEPHLSDVGWNDKASSCYFYLN